MIAQTDTHATARIIAAENDIFRTSFGRDARVPGQIVITRGVETACRAAMPALIEAVSAFDGFGEDNDPHGHHDFGAVEIAGHTVWFKIDLYDPDYAYGSETPTSTALTRRVMTLLLPSEY